jgi:hypothetical protein
LNLRRKTVASAHKVYIYIGGKYHTDPSYRFTNAISKQPLSQS